VIAALALAVAAVVAAVVILHLETNLLGRAPRDGLRVLMYHRVGHPASRAQVTPEALDGQIGWLLDNGFTPVSLSRVLASVDGGAALPPRPVLLTFDDGTLDHHRALLPVLRRRGVPAALFVIGSHLGRELEYDGRPTRFLDAAQLRELVAAGAEIGLHTFTHRDLRTLAPAEVEEEVTRSLAALAEAGVPALPVLAYPFGAYPRGAAEGQAAFFEALRRSGVRLAFRIGNRVNPLPLRSPLEVERTSVRGTDRPWEFPVKVRKGRRKAFA
jgi:peptidoglycan/xylan/chitin deacetylase (PgdA/CDA1 family)